MFVKYEWYWQFVILEYLHMATWQIASSEDVDILFYCSYDKPNGVNMLQIYQLQILQGSFCKEQHTFA